MGGPVQIGRARISFNSPQAPLPPISSLWKECIERFPNPLELFQPVLEERDSSAMSISSGVKRNESLPLSFVEKNA